MHIVVGILLVVVGVTQVVLRRQVARRNMELNSRPSRLRLWAPTGPRAEQASTVGAAAAGVLIVVAGVLVLLGVLG